MTAARSRADRWENYKNKGVPTGKGAALPPIVDKQEWMAEVSEALESMKEKMENFDYRQLVHWCPPGCASPELFVLCQLASFFRYGCYMEKPPPWIAGVQWPVSDRPLYGPLQQVPPTEPSADENSNKRHKVEGSGASKTEEEQFAEL